MTTRRVVKKYWWSGGWRNSLRTLGAFRYRRGENLRYQNPVVRHMFEHIRDRDGPEHEKLNNLLEHEGGVLLCANARNSSTCQSPSFVMSCNSYTMTVGLRDVKRMKWPWSYGISRKNNIASSALTYRDVPSMLPSSQVPTSPQSRWVYLQKLDGIRCS